MPKQERSLGIIQLSTNMHVVHRQRRPSASGVTNLRLILKIERRRRRELKKKGREEKKEEKFSPNELTKESLSP